MKRVTVLLLTFLIICLSFVNTGISSAAQSENKIRQLVRSSGPNWAPRPYKNTEYVPLKTSICSMLYVEGDENGLIDLDSITVQLIPEGKEGFYILNKNQSFSPGYSGEITRYDFSGKGKGVCIYIDTTVPLEPLTKYTVKVDAKTEKGFGIYEEDSTWSFTTEAETKTYDINASIDFSKDFDVNWHGRYFNGFVRTHGPFDPDSVIRMDYIFSDEMKAKYPNAWNLFRYEITATETFSRSIIEGFLSHFVREKETRRVLSVSETENGMLIKIEDFYGHEQYGIESNRPLSLDYHVGDEILIFDADNDRRAIVLAVNDSEQSLLVSKFDQPSKGWLIDYFSTPPTTENPYAPGLFAKGGTYLAKYNPSGTPVYYWKRLDTILDMYVNKYKQRISLNILYAYGDLSIDGKNGNRPKDYIEFHKVTYDAVTHLIERYGDQTTTWVWSIFNEPDLWPVNWRTGDWVELQKFYDYAVNAVLLAFEDKGYDSDKIIIGGLELGAIFGANVRVDDFLAHCSPVAKRDNILDYNAAYADPILRQEGKISKRVEKLCSANNGKGTPLDFISIHAYNDSLIGATKMINAKTKALDIDPEYYADLWINNYETMPSWADFEDPGASEWTWGNGYLPTWAADFYGRLLNKALEDPRFSYGDSVLTLWGWPQNMTAYMNDVVFNVTVRDGRTLENKIMPKPIFHYLNLVSTMSTDYWMIPQRQVGGHNVSGFAAPGADSDDIRMVLYSHNIDDTQSRSDAMFNFDLDLKGLKWKKVKVTEYRFDKTNNTYYSFVVKNKTKNAINMKEFETLTDLTTLKVSNEKTYEVNNDGSLKLNLPVAANGINFVILSPADDEVEPTPSPTVSPTPTVAPTESPTPSPTVAPTMTPAPSPTVNPSETPTSAPTEKPDETPTPSETDRPVETPTEKPSESPVTNDDGIMLMALLVLISGLIITVLIYRLKVKPLR